jgi:4-alpha-glucanotransferase
VDDLLLTVHDASFPGQPSEDVGRGSPYSRGAWRLCEFADALGFTGLQLGPQGITSPGNRSPYDGTVFSRSPASIAFGEIARDPAWEGLVDEDALARAVARAPAKGGRVQYDYAEHVQGELLDALFRRWGERASASLRGRFAAFCAAASPWLEHDADYEAHSDARTRFALGQFVVHAQHASFRARARGLGWKAMGDFQVGLSQRDLWRREALFLAAYKLGAPPSRTDPLGQPWGYPVPSPGSADAAALFQRRCRKAAAEYDGLRIDHPHGLVCPWVYDAGAPDPLRAVAAGARLFESPDVADHPGLARYAVARSDQIDRSVPRHDDRWVRALDDQQVSRYGERFAVLLEAVSAAGGEVACEVLSTAPYPLVRVQERYGLGRFRVTQKADLNDPRDGYRSENAAPRDWIMVATHDTPPLSRVADDWFSQGTAVGRAAYLAGRLAPRESDRTPLARWLARGRPEMLVGMFADLFASPARHVIVFMSDLFGLRDIYNRPGIVDANNWTLRVPAEFEREYRANLAAGSAMDVLGALVLALWARASDAPDAVPLARELDDARRDEIENCLLFAPELARSD